MKMTILLAGLAVIAAACSSTPPTQVASGAGGDTAHPYAASCLGKCVATTCEAQITACNGDPGCAAYLACLDACPVSAGGDADSACVAGCPAVSGSVGTAARDALDTCRTQAVCASCGGGTGGTGGAGGTCSMSPALTQQCPASTDPNLCHRCQYEHCCDSVQQVFGGGPATDYANCWLMCPDGDPACVDACKSAYPDGVAGFAEYRACVNFTCSGPGLCPISTCPTCAYDHCGCEYVACQADAACSSILDCMESCAQSPACIEACLPSTGPGADLAKTYTVCTSQHCLDVCG
jgi:hypothetical protein